MFFYCKQFYKTIFLAFRINKNKPLFIPLSLVRVMYFALTRKLFPSLQNTNFVLNVRSGKKDIVYSLKKPSDLAGLTEIYVDGEYDWVQPTPPETIIDLGAHFGDTALYYHSLYPNAEIIAVEPVEVNYRRLLENVGHIENIHSIKVAIGSQDGHVDISVSSSSLGHSVVSRVQNSDIETVPQLTLGSLLKKYNIKKVSIVKFDIEGAEEFLFSAGESLK